MKNVLSKLFHSDKVEAIIALLFGALILSATSGSKNIVPDISSLLVARGVVVNISEDKYGVDFILNDSPRGYSYTSSSKAADRVYNALSSSHKMVKILYNPNASFKSIFSSKEYFQVLSVEVDGVVIRDYKDVSDGLLDDNSVGIWLGWLFIALGGGKYIQIYLKHRT